MSDAVECRATTALLSAARTIEYASHAAAILAGLSLSYLTLVSLLPWLAVSWFSFRVRLDARLFEILADTPPEQLDAVLVNWGLIKSSRHRSIADRSLGARRLWRRQMAAFAVQVALLGTSLTLRSASL